MQALVPWGTCLHLAGHPKGGVVGDVDLGNLHSSSQLAQILPHASLQPALCSVVSGGG